MFSHPIHLQNSLTTATNRHTLDLSYLRANDTPSMESIPDNMETSNSVDGETTNIWGVHHPICGAIFPDPGHGHGYDRGPGHKHQ